ncbi:MAG: sigma-54 dependent transcriptional regulator [Burkholderiaceae bacterium]
MSETILLIDDETAIRESVGQALELADFEVVTLADAEGLAARLAGGDIDAVLTDLRLPGADGLSVLEAVRGHDPDLPVVLMTGHGDVRTAVRAMRAGAFDFIEKPFRPETIINVLRHALRLRADDGRGPSPRGDPSGATGAVSRLERSLDALERRLVGRSSAVRALRERTARYATLNADVLIHGETGTGKEVVARALHDLGSRAGARFVAINCATLPGDLIASELFGHEPGAFTGARARRVGKFEFAHGGTVFLDEIESMPLSLQAELLRVLQERRFARLGGNDEIDVDIRVVAAAKVDLRAWAVGGRFREDLFYRLDVLTIDVPPLRARVEDIPLLFEHFMRAAADAHDVPLPALADDLRAALQVRSWPGNVRELQNAALRFVLEGGDRIPGPAGGAALRDPAPAGPGAADGDSATDAQATSLAERVAAFEASLIQAALDRHGGDLAATERELDISRRTLHEKIRRYGLSRRR